MRSLKKKPARKRRKKLDPRGEQIVRQIADLLRDVPEEERAALVDEARWIAFSLPERNN
jgi:hypothetical protein